MSYYLDQAELLEKRGEHVGAAIIRELYCSKVELEQMVKTISAGRDLLIKELEELEGSK